MFGVAKRGQNSIGKYLCKKHKISILHRVNSPIHSHPPSPRTAVLYRKGEGWKQLQHLGECMVTEGILWKENVRQERGQYRKIKRREQESTEERTQHSKLNQGRRIKTRERDKGRQQRDYRTGREGTRNNAENNKRDQRSVKRGRTLAKRTEKQKERNSEENKTTKRDNRAENNKIGKLRGQKIII